MTRRNPFSRRGFLRSAGLAAALPGLTLAQGQGKPDATSGKRNHKYENFLPEDFYKEFERAPIIYWACGAMEEHGLQCALATDLYAAYEVCLRAADISGGIVFPPVPFAPAARLSRAELRSGQKELFPPSLWVSRELCRQVYIELLESMADMGFKSCIAFGGHAPADSLLQEIDKEYGSTLRGMKFWGGGTCRILADHMAAEAKAHPLGAGHGMQWETSLVMALRKDWVDAPRARRIKENKLPSQLKKQAQERLDYIATDANAELGNRALNLAAERAAQLATDMLR